MKFGNITALVISFSIFSVAGASEFTVQETSIHTTNITGWDGGEIDSGPVAYHEGKFHMMYSGRTFDSKPRGIGYAISSDGLEWTRVTEDSPLITIEDAGERTKSVLANSVFIEEDGTWVLYFTAAEGYNQMMGVIMRATAPSPSGPWKVYPDPVLKPGKRSEWDGERIGDASVNRTKDGYVMHYSAFGLGELESGEIILRGKVGLAYSRDGIAWKKYNDPATNDEKFVNGDPVFEKDSHEDTWEGRLTYDSNVDVVNGRWTMAYRNTKMLQFGQGTVGFATSNDGIHWERHQKTPVATEKMVKQRAIWGISHLHHDGIDYIWFTAGWLDNERIFVMMHSED